MLIWDTWYYVVPVWLAARYSYVSYGWLIQQYHEGKLIGTKIGGAVWLALSECENTVNISCTGIVQGVTVDKNSQRMK